MDPPKSEFPSNIEAADQQTKDDKYKRSGQIVFRVNNFRTFAGGGSQQLISESAECINGLPWRIILDHLGADLSFSVQCDGNPNDKAWSCQASVRKSIVACKYGYNCFTDEEMRSIFNAESREWGNRNFIKFEQLIDAKNGWFDEAENAVTFMADVAAERPNGMPGARLKDILLVNNEIVYVNKYRHADKRSHGQKLLAAHSDFFETLYFGENAEQKPKIQIDNVPEAVAHFERLIASMPPQNKALDDECIESVLELADRYLLDSVKNCCVNFLEKTSKKSALFKLRLAEKYGFDALKKHILKTLTVDDFYGGSKYFDDFSELNKLGDELVKELRERHKALFDKK